MFQCLSVTIQRRRIQRLFRCARIFEEG